MNQLRNQRDCLDEHGERNEHLKGQEVLAFVAWVEYHREDKADRDEHIPSQVRRADALVDRVLVLIAKVDDIAMKKHCCEDLDS